MTDYFIPQRYDDKAAEAGVWFEIETERGEKYGSFLCTLIDKHNPRTVKAAERFRKRYDRLKNVPGYKEKMNADLFVEISLIDWKLNDAKGKPIPFSRDEAIAYLTAVPFVLEQLDRHASDALNYPGEDTEDAVKN
ncbi:MAG: hypothetical protein ACSLE1_15710 [Sphingobium sp.]